jgi:hypothetical protein
MNSAQVLYVALSGGLDEPQFPNFLKNPPKLGFGHHAHGSIHIQEGEPNFPALS